MRSKPDHHRRSPLVLAGAMTVLLSFVVPTGARSSPSQRTDPSPALAFARYGGGSPSIYSIDADGTDERRLTATPRGAFEGQPTYSPDGNRIAYICGNFEVCVMNADGSGAGRLTTSRWPATWEYADHPSWSPDGTKIAFASNTGGAFHVYVINADGSGLRRLAGTAQNDDDPSWSPDGTKIAFDSYHSWNGPTALYVMNADGTRPRQLTRGGDSGHPSWSPDGSRIVFDRYQDDNTHLFLINADGSGETQLTDGYCDEFDPTWSPEGPTLAFERSCNGSLGITVGDFSRVARITAPREGFDLYPAWRPVAAEGQGDIARPIDPPSTPTGDARLVGVYFQWDIQVRAIDFLPDSSARMERKIRSDDLSAATALAAAQPETARGKVLQRTATKAFRLDAASSKDYLRSYQASGRGDEKAAARWERAGNRLAERAQRQFDAAEDLARLPY